MFKQSALFYTEYAGDAAGHHLRPAPGNLTFIVEIQKQIITFVKHSNWILFLVFSLVAYLFWAPAFLRGIVCGGILVTLNFHLMARTLRKALTPPHLASLSSVIAKYYVRFIISGIIIFFLISRQWVDPLGLIAGLSIVVISLMLASLREITKIIFFKEAM